MKNYILYSVAALAVALASGCASTQPRGALITDVTLPIAVASNPRKAETPKVGKSQCNDVLGLIANGDASINAAMQNGNIKTIYYVDWKANNILGLIGTYECTVYGE